MSLNQKQLKEKLDEWAGVQAKIEKFAGQKNKKLDPFLKEHQEKIAPILDDYNAKVQPLSAKQTQLESEINAMLKANADSEGNPKTLTVASEKAQVTVSKSEGSRVVSVQKFFESVKEKNSQFWASLTVVIKNAEKVLSKEKIDEISTKKTTFPIAISLKK